MPRLLRANNSIYAHKNIFNKIGSNSWSLDGSVAAEPAKSWPEWQKKLPDLLHSKILSTKPSLNTVPYAFKLPYTCTGKDLKIDTKLFSAPQFLSVKKDDLNKLMIPIAPAPALPLSIAVCVTYLRDCNIGLRERIVRVCA